MKKLWLALILLSRACGPEPVMAEPMPANQWHAFKWAMGELRLPVTHGHKKIKDLEPKLEVLFEVVRKVDYVPDQLLYADPLHWARPSEFAISGGQCRDYAVTNYYGARELGLADEQLHVVVGWLKSTGELHAVLRIDAGGQTFVLDNLHEGVLNADDLKDLVPVYAVNRLGWTDLSKKKEKTDD